MKQRQTLVRPVGASPRLLDGAMGTELFRRGVAPGTCLEQLVLTDPALIRSIHRAYRRAGADIISTHTFGANRARLAPYGLDSSASRINAAAVQLARSAANGALVAGVLGPAGSAPESELASIFAEQAAALRGVDLVLLETFSNVRHLFLAAHAARNALDVPIVAQVVPGRPVNRALLDDLVARLAAAVDTVGVNCANTMDDIENSIAYLRSVTPLPLSAEPNAGIPISESERLRYPIDPNAFACAAQRLAPYVSLIGGCCGTTPAHIQAARHALDSL